jgi:hypothetical protein
VSAADQAYVQYRTPRAYEWMLRVGDPRTPPILFVPPLFEELNRLRALIVAMMRRLAAEGHGCWLPDLSGANESLLALETVTWEDWRQDLSAAASFIAEAAGREPVVASIRGGALLDDTVDAAGWWRFAPARGQALARELDRASLAGGAEWAGYPAAPDLRDALKNALPQALTPLRTLRLDSDAAEADAKLVGPALWRRSEPGTSAVLADALAADLNSWSRACAAS